MPSRLNRLLALSEQEFRKQRAAPVRQKFKARRLDLSKLDTDWDSQRGAAVRMMAIVLSDDDEALNRRVSTAAETFSDAAAWFKKEASYLRKTASLFDTAVARLTAAIARDSATDTCTAGGSALNMVAPPA